MKNAPETYRTLIPDWATQLELIVHEPGESPIVEETFDVKSEFKIEFLVATISTPNGHFPNFLDAKLSLVDPNKNSYAVTIHTPSPSEFVSDKPALVIIENPVLGNWDVSAVSGVIPYAVTVMAFHPQVSPISPPSPGPSSGSPFKCRACKTTAKGLGLAIVAAATLPAIPAAILSAISTYLGTSIVVAAAFISSVIGDAAELIAEKLCKRVGLC